MNNKIVPILPIERLSSQNVPKEYHWAAAAREQNFDKHLGKHGVYCHHPFSSITIDQFGYVFLCACQAWLPINVGKIWDFKKLEDILEHPVSVEIQNSIANGSYRYCDTNACGVFYREDNVTDYGLLKKNINWVNLAFDNSCNLTCPSCRTEFKFVNEGSEYDLRISIAEHLVHLIEKYENPLKLSLSNDGDPFASLVYRNFLSNLDLSNKPNVEIDLVTNGILLAQFWDKLDKIHSNISSIKISMDAGSKEIYEHVRTGGDWDRLIQNIKFITEWRTTYNKNLKLISNFVVQQKNYKDILKYIDLCLILNFDSINLQKVENWGTFTKFIEEAVWNEQHLEYDELASILNNPAVNDKKVDLTNLSYIKINNQQNTNNKLSDLVTLKRNLNEINVDIIYDAIENVDGKVSSTLNIELGPDYVDDINQIIAQIDKLEQEIEAISKNIRTLGAKTNQDIRSLSTKFTKRGYTINGQLGSNKTDIATERETRSNTLSQEIYSEVLSRIKIYSDWHYPGLEIGPGDGVWTEHLVASDPLYLIDIEQEYLTNTLNKFNPVYRNRLRPYLTGGWVGRSDFDYSQLPAGQFGFIFSWNVFDYFPLHETKVALTECFKLLRPGGVMLFSFNNCDYPQCVGFVEKGFKSWMPSADLLDLCATLGYEVIRVTTNEEAVCWIEIKKPGELNTVKAHQALGKIINHNA